MSDLGETMGTMDREPYGYTILSCVDFDQVLSRTGKDSSFVDLWQAAFRDGRVLLQAPGGSGKTYSLERIAEDFAATGGFVCWLRFGDVVIETLGSAAAAKLSCLVPEMSETLRLGRQVLLLVDGLNEADRDLAPTILVALGHLAANNPNLGIIVTDRLTRRPLPPHSWSLATLSPVPKSAIGRLVDRAHLTDADYDLLSTPVYLELAMHGSKAKTRSDSHTQALKKLHLNSSEIDLLAEHALRQYQSLSSRVFSLSELKREVGAELLSRCVASGLIVDVGADSSRYNHHLVHDFLAARAAARRPDSWTIGLFDELSFRHSSFDSLVLLLEQASPDLADSLVRKIYDWDLYAAAYVLGEDADNGKAVALHTEAEVLALLGERRFDLFISSATQVSDALRLHPTPLAKRYLHASDVSEVLKIASSVLPENSEYQSWLRYFLSSVSQRKLLDAMVDHESVAGWTCANVIRRSLSRESIRRLVALSDHSDKTVRWRVAHALGASKLQYSTVLETLFARLESDPADTVKYGALRSVIELTASMKSRASRTASFTRLAGQIGFVTKSSRLMTELEKTVQLRPGQVPEGWVDDVAVVIQELLLRSSDLVGQDRWRALSSKMRSEVA